MNLFLALSATLSFAAPAWACEEDLRANRADTGLAITVVAETDRVRIMPIGNKPEPILIKFNFQFFDRPLFVETEELDGEKMLVLLDQQSLKPLFSIPMVHRDDVLAAAEFESPDGNQGLLTLETGHKVYRLTIDLSATDQAGTEQTDDGQGE